MSNTEEPVKDVNPWFGNKTYDRLKFLAQIGLPALGTLYFALASIWGMPYGEEVSGTILAVDTFLGVILGISSAQYVARSAASVAGVAANPEVFGTLHWAKYDEDSGNINLEIHRNPNEMENLEQITLNVVKEVPSAQPGELPPVNPPQA